MMIKVRRCFILIVLIILMSVLSTVVSFASLCLSKSPKPKLTILVSNKGGYIAVGTIGLLVVKVENERCFLCSPADRTKVVLRIKNGSFVPLTKIGDIGDFENFALVNDHVLELSFAKQLKKGESLSALIGFVPRGEGELSVEAEAKMVYCSDSVIRENARKVLHAMAIRTVYNISDSTRFNHEYLEIISKNRLRLFNGLISMLKSIEEDYTYNADILFERGVLMTCSIAISLSEMVLEDNIDGLLKLYIPEQIGNIYEVFDDVKSTYDRLAIVYREIVETLSLSQDMLNGLDVAGVTSALIQGIGDLVSEIEKEDWKHTSINSQIDREANIIHSILEGASPYFPYTLFCTKRDLASLSHCFIKKGGKYTQFGVLLDVIYRILLSDWHYLARVKSLITDCDADGVLDFEDDDLSSCVYITCKIHPKTITLGDSFTIEVTAINYTREDGKAGGITVSFPKFDGKGDAERVELLGSSNGIYTVRENGDNIFCSDYTSCIAKYLLVENWGIFNWRNNGRVTFKVKVTPKSIGDFPINIRSVIEFGDRKIFSPENTPYTDQQGWHVYRYYVKVKPPNRDPKVYNVYPSNYADDVPIDLNLKWAGWDPDEDDSVIYKVYLSSDRGSYDKVCETYSLECPVTLQKGTTYYWYVVATDKNGATAKTSIWSFTTVSNAAPAITSFTADPTAGEAPLTVNFHCSASDSDGSITEYRIDYGDGSSDSNSSGAFTHTYERAGTYQATCTVVDDEGAMDSQTMKIDVSSCPDAVGDSVNEASHIQIPYNSTERLCSEDNDYYRIEIFSPGRLVIYTEGSIDTYGYLLDEYGNTMMDDDSGANTNFRIEADVDPGVYYIRVRGYNSDTHGEYTLHVEFQPKNQLPQITSFTADPTAGEAPLTVNFHCSASDSDGSITEYRIDYGDGSSDSNSSGAFTHTYERAGTYQATCTVVDDEGAMDSQTITISVSAHQNQPPVIVSFFADPGEGSVPLEVSFHCSALDFDGYVRGYIIDFGDGDITNGTSVDFYHTYQQPGTYYATCEAVDDQGTTSEESSVTIIVNSSGPGAEPPPTSPPEIGVGDSSTWPVKLLNMSFTKAVAIKFNYSGSVDILVGWMPEDFSTVEWLDPVSCSFDRPFSYVSGTTGISCPVAPLPGEGYVFWLVSAVPLEDLDFDNGPYELKFFHIEQ